MLRAHLLYPGLPMIRPHHPFSNSPVEYLPFVVHTAQTPEDFNALCRLRSLAYARHNYTASLPGRLACLDDFDIRGVLLMATCKATKECIGTLRVSFSERGETPRSPYEPLGIIGDSAFAYIDRFAVEVGERHITIRRALMKAMWLMVCEHETPWVVASALAPLARLYRGVGMGPIPGAGGGFRHPKLHDTALYYVVGGKTEDLHRNVFLRRPEDAEFFSSVRHPDILGEWPPAYFLDPGRAPEYLEQMTELATA